MSGQPDARDAAEIAAAAGRRESPSSRRWAHPRRSGIHGRGLHDRSAGVLRVGAIPPAAIAEVLEAAGITPAAGDWSRARRRRRRRGNDTASRPRSRVALEVCHVSARRRLVRRLGAARRGRPGGLGRDGGRAPSPGATRSSSSPARTTSGLGRPGGPGHLAHQQVRRGSAGQAVLRRLRVRGRRRGPRPRAGPRAVPGLPSTSTSSRIPAPRRTWPPTSRCSARATGSWA